MNHKHFYIVVVDNIHSIFYYSRGCRTPSRAMAIADAYVEDSHYMVLSGIEVSLFNLRKARTPFPDNLPSEIAGGVRHSKDKKARKELKGIRPHLFRKKWEPLPKSKKDRLKEFNKGQRQIRQNLLK